MGDRRVAARDRRLYELLDRRIIDIPVLVERRVNIRRVVERRGQIIEVPPTGERRHCARRVADRRVADRRQYERRMAQ